MSWKRVDGLAEEDRRALSKNFEANASNSGGAASFPTQHGDPAALPINAQESSRAMSRPEHIAPPEVVSPPPRVVRRRCQNNKLTAPLGSTTMQTSELWSSTSFKSI